MSVNYETVPSPNYAVISLDDARQKGFKRYFTGRTCKYGHVAERLTYTRTCVICHNEKRNTQRAKDPKAEIAKVRSWQKKNIEKKRYYNRQYYYKDQARKRVEKGRGRALQSGQLMDLSEAIDIFKAAENAFDFVEDFGKNR